jgi:hypothetical protein
VNIPKISALYESSLASALSAAGSSFVVVSGNDRDSNALSGLYGFIIDEGSAEEEFIIGTISSGTVTITYRGIDADAPNTEITGNKKAHRRGASVKITDYPITGVLRNILNGDEGLPNKLKYASAPTFDDPLQIPSKGYVDNLTVSQSGVPDGSTTTKGIFEEATQSEIDADTGAGATSARLAVNPSTLVLSKYGTRLPSSDEKAGLAGGGDFGIPSTSNKYLTQDYNASSADLPVVRVYTPNTPVGSSTTRFDITNITGNTYRYTFDGTGTDPSISAGTFPIGTVVDIQAQNFSAGNKGLFVTTGVGSNYIEISNASGVAENDKTIGTGYIVKGAIYTKPAGLKYITIRQVGAGAPGAGTTSSDAAADGGASGAYAEKLIATAALAATVNYCIGYKGVGNTSTGSIGGRTIFSHSTPIITNGGNATTAGTASGGDINITGQLPIAAFSSSTGPDVSGTGGSTPLGLGGSGVTGGDVNGTAGVGYGAGGGGSNNTGSGTTTGGDGANGLIILTEYYA